MKEVILKKSLELFTNNGFKSVTMDDIAAELGISKKTIYQHFSSKNELIGSTVDFVYDSAMNQLKNIVSKSESPIHEHFEMKSCVADMFGQKINAATVYQFNKYYPKLAERLRKRRYQDFEFTIIRNLREGVNKGYYRKEMDIDFIGKVFFLSSSAFFHDEAFMDLQNTQSIDDLDAKFTEYHLRGIVTPKGLEILEQLLKTHK